MKHLHALFSAIGCPPVDLASCIFSEGLFCRVMGLLRIKPILCNTIYKVY